jgi:hypothetical protein
MYDWGNTDSSLEIFSGPGSVAETVYFTQEDSSWYACLSGGAEIDLGESLDFGFSFGDGTSMYYTYDLTVIDAGEVYQLSPDGNDITIYTSDVAPVPLPASALLLGSGMVGLIAFGRVRLRGIFS